jgi:hypothetical protein
LRLPETKWVGAGLNTPVICKRSIRHTGPIRLRSGGSALIA